MFNPTHAGGGGIVEGFGVNSTCWQVTLGLGFSDNIGGPSSGKVSRGV